MPSPDAAPRDTSRPAGTVPTSTVSDVAAEAGVSRQTVSNVLNAPDRVRPATRRRVESAIARLGYRPNRAAQALRASASRLIGYRIAPTRPDALSSILDRFLHALSETAHAVDHQVLVFAAAPDDELAACGRLIRSGAVDGFVLHDLAYSDPRPAALAALGAPFAAFGRTADEHLWIDVDNRDGADRATEHLIATGHRRIAFLGWPDGSRIGDDRAEGWRRAMRRHGLPTADLRHRTRNTIEAGARLATELAARTDPPTALVAVSDVVAVGALRASPAGTDTVAVVGFDDTPTAAVLGLSSVRQPIEEVARRLTADLLTHLPGAPATGEHRPTRATPADRLVPADLIVRDSTARRTRT